MQIELIDIEKLIPYAMNARTHSDAQVAQIAGSIKEFGFTNPCLIDEENGLIAGHGRVMAARKLKIKEIPCIRLAHLTEVQKKAYILADNRIALNSGWDIELLENEMRYLDDKNFNLSDLGFDEKELQMIADVSPLDEMPNLKDGAKEPIQQMTFILHDEQVNSVEHAMKLAKEKFDIQNDLNTNSNGNAISLICEMFLTTYADR